MPGPRHLPRLLEALQGVPAALHLDWTAELGRHPVGHRPRRPVLAPVGRRAGQRHPQLLPARSPVSMRGGRQDVVRCLFTMPAGPSALERLAICPIQVRV